MVAWVALVVLEGFCVWWLIKVARSGAHEVPIALGFMVYIYACLHVFGHFPPEFGDWESPIALKVVGIALLVLAGAVFGWCMQLMKTLGAAEANWEDTRELVEVGPFGLVRHPVYASAAAAALGVALCRLTPFSIALGAVAIILFYLGARFEDGYNSDKFGEVYDGYRQRTKLMVPLVL